MRSAAFAELALLLMSCLNQNTQQQTCYKIVESVVTEQGESSIVPAPCPPDFRGPGQRLKGPILMLSPRDLPAGKDRT